MPEPWLLRPEESSPNPTPIAPITSLDALVHLVRSAIARSKQTAPSPELLSIALPLDSLEPLLLLQDWRVAATSHLYWEQPDRQEWSVSVGELRRFQGSGSDRFAEAQTFAVETFGRLAIVAAGGDTAAIAPQLACSFAFFEGRDQAWDGFAPAQVSLPEWQVLHRGGQTILWVNHPLADLVDPDSPDIEAHLTDRCSKIWAIHQRLQRLPRSIVLADPNPLVQPRSGNQGLGLTQPLTPIDHFETSVASVLELIGNGKLHKVVLARAIAVEAEAPLAAEAILSRLRQSHPDCCLFALGNGQGSRFVGASPERLIEVRSGELYTEALAGSAPRGKTIGEDQRQGSLLRANVKELREHRLVTHFILDALEELGLNPHWASHPKLLQLANIQHLQTPIRATLPPSVHPLAIVAQLHPTPAVAGVPRDQACELILRHEPLVRSHYAAPIGWIDAEGNSAFVVGIRSALIQGNRATLYGGAGIVAGSSPSQELAETGLKLQPLLRALTWS